MKATVGIYCDLGPSLGAGHFVRCSALGAALVAEGARVEIVADFASVPWAAEQAADLGLAAIQGLIPDAVARASAWDVAVVDSYLASASDFAGLPVPLAAIDDEDRRPLPAALVVNQNLNAPECLYSGWPAESVLRGPAYALVRPRIRAARPPSYSERDWSGRPQRVLVVLGGTDAGGGAATVAALALSALAPVDLRVISPRPLGALPVPPGSSLEVTGTVLAVEELMTGADLVLSAAGTTIFELCCLGVPMALAVAADNQLPNYGHVLRDGLGAGLGRVGEITSLPGELRDPALLNAHGKAAYATVDGLGAARVAEAVLALAR
jgi:spore coat polysaccharide biosynthesis predicted glycosyltransferase SpsG